ncbi:MAG: transcription-repair coupling factor [Spirochaetaceae bacterium]|nr:transcription-repair coupling factor [Spirochaetaceae bacterium]
MNTLYPDLLQKKIHSWNEMQKLILSLEKNAYPQEIEGIQNGLYGFFISEYLNAKKEAALHSLQYGTKVPAASDSDLIVVVPTEKDAESLYTDFKGAFPPQENAKTGETEIPVVINKFSWWGLVPYRPASRGSLVFGERAAFLAKLAARKDKAFTKNEKPNIFVMTQRAFQTPVPPPEYEKSLLFSIHTGDQFDSQSLAEKLVQNGYVRVPRVTVKGEFTLRGEVLDIYMPGEDYAYRITFDFDAVDKIRAFNTADQTSVASLDSIVVYPMKEVVWTDELVEKLSSIIEKNKTEFPSGCETLLTELSVSKESEGEELFYPLLFADGSKKNWSVADYVSPDTAVMYIDYDRLTNAQESLEREYEGLYKKAKAAADVPVPEDILFKFDDVEKRHKKNIYLRTIHGKELESAEWIKLETDAPRSFFGNITYLKEQLASLRNDGWTFFIYAESENQALRIGELLKDFPEIHIVPLPLSGGFGIPSEKILVIQENEIFGRRKHIPKSTRYTKSAVIDTFVELNPGDYVVHVNYGIGLFKGIERVRTGGNERDYIKIEYADEENVFIPIEQVNLVQRYIGNEGNDPKLDRLGSKSWENRKNKVKKSVEDIAQRLILLYSKRKAARGFPFPKDGEFQIAFDAAFPYEETEDQLTCIEEVKADMEKPVPMDRLICGDVGYGKTEIAMRAAFKAVMGGKQVALLAPTTILAEQHYENCVERFENFPVKIAQLSRFIPPAEQKKTLEKLKNGELDIIIGTHRIIQKDVVFKDLGLMIIDEEQRFGVKDKERLKELKTNIDSLAMSATPIPRTLHMSMLKIRDMSILNTPPQNRQAIETVIDSYNDERVAKAIRQEVERGGQVFFLHNRVETLEETRRKLEQLVPEMLIDIAHGQMSAGELDDIFRRFKMGGFHVLVSTTIIENGIDIPNVNTIIIDRADMYGVSQLYQLRGRVGRSDRKAYAYLLYPENKSLSEIAMKRLQVISDFTELGSGFKIAMKDMEIRGAGNLLGKDQSGDVYSVGFDLYLRLLEEAVQRLSDENYQEENEVLLELEYSGFIPETYIQNPQTKMEVYKKIASVNTKTELEQVYFELSDRFGPIPDEVQSLLSLAEIRIICKKLYISTLKERNGEVSVDFAKVSNISVEKVLRLIKENAGRVKLDPHKPNMLILQTGKIGLKEKSEFIREKLEQLL